MIISNNLFKYLLAIISGIFYFLSFPKFGDKTFAWFCLSPLLFIVVEDSLSYLENDRSIKKEIITLSFITGTIGWCGILYWIVPTFIIAGEHFMFGSLALVALSFYCSLYLVGFNLGVHFFLKFFKKLNLLVIIVVSSLWVLTEYLRGWLFSGFPWMLLGYSQYDNLALIQIAEYFGVYGVSFILVFVNLFIVWYFHRLFNKRPVRFVSLFIFLISITTILIFGIIKISKINKQLQNSNKTITVALLQGNIDQYKKWDKEYIEEIMLTYTKLVQNSVMIIKQTTKKNYPSLFIWPESATPGWLFDEKKLYSWVSNLVEFTHNQFNQPVYHLIGTIRSENNRSIYYNSAALFSYKNNGVITENIYDKIHLVPFGEYVPFKKILSKFIKTVNELGEFTAGKNFTVFNIEEKNISFATLICYESIFPELTSKFFSYDVDFLVNITNDAWFLKTSAPYQHFIANIFRAVENRCYVVRCANTGISAVISPTGKVIQKTDLFKTITLINEMKTYHYKTFYSKFARWLWIMYFLVVLIPFKIQFIKTHL